jgi:hypothetical protein
VPDVKIDGATPAEVEAYRRFAEMYRREWTRTDPVAVAVRSIPTDREGLTRVVFDVAVTPFARRHYGFIAGFLPEPDRDLVTAPPGNLLFLQCGMPHQLFDAVIGDRTDAEREAERDGNLFIGLQDFPVPVGFHRGEVVPPEVDDDDLPWFAGHFGADTVLKLLNTGLNRDQVEAKNEGYVEWQDDQSIRMWDKRWGAIGRSRAVLETVTPHLKRIQADRPAQLRLRLADLSDSRVRPVLEANAYAFARRASARNANLLHQAAQQFRLEPQAARAAVEQVFDGTLVCPLGGEYRLTDDDDEPGEWVSTRWPRRSRFQEDAVPPGFRHPFVEGLHGAEVELTLSIPTETLSSHVELTVPAAAGLPPAR